MYESTGVATDGPANMPSSVTGDQSTEANNNLLARASVDKTTEAAADKPTKTLQLHGQAALSYDSALDTDKNYIKAAESAQENQELCRRLWTELRPAMGGLVRHHLNLQDDDAACDIAATENWIIGGFNVCIPITVQLPARRYQLILRHALPSKLRCRDSDLVNEKASCEVASYVWMQEKCPDIPIPRLYGFGFSDHRHVRPL